MSTMDWISLGAGIGFVVGFPLGAVWMGKRVMSMMKKSFLGGGE